MAFSGDSGMGITSVETSVGLIEGSGSASVGLIETSLAWSVSASIRSAPV